LEKFNHRSSQQAEIANLNKNQRHGEATIASTIRVFVVDNQPVFNTGIQAILKTTTDLRMVGAVESLNLLSPRLPEIPPHVGLFSADTIDECLLGAINAWRQKYEECKILLVVAYSVEVNLPQLASQGVNGLILRTDAPQQFVRAIRAVSKGEDWFSRKLLQKVVQVQISFGSPPMQLTEQDEAILQLLCAEKSNCEIAGALHVSERTICRYLEDIYIKLGVNSRVGAVIRAVKMGLA